MRAYPSGALLHDSTYTLWLAVENAIPLSDKQGATVDAEWVLEHQPHSGGYYCVDADDNDSFIPAAAFHAHFRPCVRCTRAWAYSRLRFTHTPPEAIPCAESDRLRRAPNSPRGSVFCLSPAGPCHSLCGDEGRRAHR